MSSSSSSSDESTDRDGNGDHLRDGVWTLDGDFQLQGGSMLRRPFVKYRTQGRLAPAKNNVILHLLDQQIISSTWPPPIYVDKSKYFTVAINPYSRGTQTMECDEGGWDWIQSPLGPFDFPAPKAQKAALSRTPGTPTAVPSSPKTAAAKQRTQVVQQKSNMQNNADANNAAGIQPGKINLFDAVKLVRLCLFEEFGITTPLRCVIGEGYGGMYALAMLLPDLQDGTISGLTADAVCMIEIPSRKKRHKKPPPVLHGLHSQISQYIKLKTSPPSPTLALLRSPSSLLQRPNTATPTSTVTGGSARRKQDASKEVKSLAEMQTMAHEPEHGSESSDDGLTIIQREQKAAAERIALAEHKDPKSRHPILQSINANLSCLLEALTMDLVDYYISQKQHFPYGFGQMRSGDIDWAQWGTGSGHDKRFVTQIEDLLAVEDQTRARAQQKEERRRMNAKKAQAASLLMTTETTTVFQRAAFHQGARPAVFEDQPATSPTGFGAVREGDNANKVQPEVAGVDKYKPKRVVFEQTSTAPAAQEEDKIARTVGPDNNDQSNSPASSSGQAVVDSCAAGVQEGEQQTNGVPAEGEAQVAAEHDDKDRKEAYPIGRRLTRRLSKEWGSDDGYSDSDISSTGEDFSRLRSRNANGDLVTYNPDGTVKSVQPRKKRRLAPRLLLLGTREHQMGGKFRENLPGSAAAAMTGTPGQDLRVSGTGRELVYPSESGCRQLHKVLTQMGWPLERVKLRPFDKYMEKIEAEEEAKRQKDLQQEAEDLLLPQADAEVVKLMPAASRTSARIKQFLDHRAGRDLEKDTKARKTPEERKAHKKQEQEEKLKKLEEFAATAAAKKAGASSSDYDSASDDPDSPGGRKKNGGKGRKGAKGKQEAGGPGDQSQSQKEQDSSTSPSKGNSPTSSPDGTSNPQDAGASKSKPQARSPVQERHSRYTSRTYGSFGHTNHRRPVGSVPNMHGAAANQQVSRRQLLVEKLNATALADLRSREDSQKKEAELRADPKKTNVGRELSLADIPVDENGNNIMHVQQKNVKESGKVRRDYSNSSQPGDNQGEEEDQCSDGDDDDCTAHSDDLGVHDPRLLSLIELPEVFSSEAESEQDPEEQIAKDRRVEAFRSGEMKGHLQEFLKPQLASRAAKVKTVASIGFLDRVKQAISPDVAPGEQGGKMEG
ncbi:unnamed protein product [Amoebophrya sp. A25]|nr:unnamed protein product [Amoebophrya sp. A25]|eukprot:GSA25T00024635001.1